MIAKHPLTGFGIGSFYLHSVSFASAGDPNAFTPDFAHNAFLQIAVEDGVPVAAMFVLLLANIVFLAMRTSIRMNGPQPLGLLRGSIPFALLFGVAAYIETQMTANSLNVYASNQFFFWFLMAALFSLVKGEAILDSTRPPDQQ